MARFAPALHPDLEWLFVLLLVFGSSRVFSIALSVKALEAAATLSLVFRRPSEALKGTVQHSGSCHRSYELEDSH